MRYSPSPRLVDVLRVLCLKVRPLILETWPPNTCIAATRVAFNVLTNLGFACTPVSVCAVVINGELRAKYEEGNSEGVREVDANTSRLGSVAGGWLCDAGWSGHLVLIASGYVLDLSLDQASSSEKGILARPVVLDIRRAEVIAGAWWWPIGSCGVLYRFLWGDKSFVHTSDWAASPNREIDAMTRRATAVIRDNLGF